MSELYERDVTDYVREAWESGDMDDAPLKRYLITGPTEFHCVVVEGAIERPRHVRALRNPTGYALNLRERWIEGIVNALLHDALNDPKLALDIQKEFKEKVAYHWIWANGISITAAEIQNIVTKLCNKGEVYADPFADE